jgi:Fanconi anemia group M protein
MNSSFKPRTYQEEIIKTATNNNTLVVLPTGTGKTAVAVLTAIERLKQNKYSNILVLTPTKPLSAQIQKEFIENTNIPKEQITLLTGEITPKKRKELWETAIITVATPQTIQKDLENDRISLSPTSLLVVDECHRSRQNFANTVVAKKYIEQGKDPRILALTASPGGTKSKIEEIKENLFIEEIEIRTEDDIREFIQKKEANWLEVELSKDLKQLHKLIKRVYNEKLKGLKKVGVTKPLNMISKKDLIMLQNKYRSQIRRKNPAVFFSIFITALLIKIDYAAELLETQGIISLQSFWNKLKNETSKSAKAIINLPEIQQAIRLTDSLVEKDIIPCVSNNSAA